VQRAAWSLQTVAAVDVARETLSFLVGTSTTRATRMLTAALTAAIVGGCAPATTEPAPSPSSTATPPNPTLSLPAGEHWYAIATSILSGAPEALRRADAAMRELAGGALDQAGAGPILEVTMTIHFGDPKADTPTIRVSAVGEQATAEALFEKLSDIQIPGRATLIDLGHLGTFAPTGKGHSNQYGTLRARPPSPLPSIVVPVALGLIGSDIKSNQELSTKDWLLRWRSAAPDHWQLATGSITNSNVLRVTERQGETYVLLNDSDAKGLRLVYSQAASLPVGLHDLPTGYADPIRPHSPNPPLSFHSLGGMASRDVERSSDSALLSVAVVVLYSEALASEYLINFKIGLALKGEYREVSGPGIADDSADFVATSNPAGTSATFALARVANVVIYGLGVTPRSNEPTPIRALMLTQVDKVKADTQSLRLALIPAYVPR
jgi:hypothetical protein